MKLIVIFLLAGLLEANAKGYSQQVTIVGKNLPLEAVFEMVRIQTGNQAIFDPELIKDLPAVNLNLKNAPLKTLLDECFKGSMLAYDIRYKTIVIRRSVPSKPVITTAGEDPALAPIEIRGRVLNEKGEPLAAVSIRIKGTNQGVSTDSDGAFTLSVPKNTILLISSVGYESQEIKVTAATVSIVLAPKTTEIDQLVVVGYGAVKRKNVTGSVSTVKMEDVNTASSTNFAQAIAGRAAGVSAIQSSGQPGAGVNIQVRSNPSYASPGALYVIDGVIINDNAGEASASTRYGGSGVDRSALNFINPNDIETIDFLKDASATAIYGARAGGGVVLITTKKGKAGKPTVAYDGSFSSQHAFKFYDILGTKDYMEQRNLILYEKYLSDNKIAPYGTTDPTAVAPFVPKYTDAQISSQAVMPSAIDAIKRNGYTQQHNISVSGMSNKTRYFTSLNYFEQDGVLIHSDYKRYNGRLNLEQGLSDHFKIGANVIVSGSTATNPNVGTSQNEYAGMITSAFYYPATMPLMDSLGNYPINPDYQNAPNPLSFREITDYTINNRLLASGFAEWKIIPALTAKASFSWDQSTSTRYSYLPKSFLYGARAGGQASINEDNARSKLAEYTLNYDRSFGNAGHLSLVAGHSYQLSDWYGTSIYNDHFPTDNFTFNNIGLGEAVRPSVGSYRNPTRVWKSYFGRLIYSYKDRYILTASVRKDGASHFAENKKWGTFPGVSLGWILTEEDFLKGIHPISFLKLRAGYGTTGNSEIGSSAFAYYGSSDATSYVFGNSLTYGIALTQLANSNLTWETQKDINLGLDYQLFKGRISGSFDYYIRTVSNLLSSVPLSTSFPVSSVATNSGTTRSRGWDLAINSKNIVSPQDGGFNWTTSINLSHYYNYWVRRSPETLKTLAKYIDPKGPFNGIYGYLSDGIYKGDKTLPAMPGAIPGGIIVKDVNGYDGNGNLTGKPDGQISSADQVLLGVSGTRYNLGFNNTFTYRGFDLSIYMYGYIQVKYNSDYANAFSTYAQLGQFGWNVLSISKDRWRYNNTSAKYPTGLSDPYATYSSNSNYWLENANFIRLRDITLGYTFDPRILNFQHYISSIRVYASAQNPFVITSYKGMDPELQNFLAYPMTRNYTVGVNVKF